MRPRINPPRRPPNAAETSGEREASRGGESSSREDISAEWKSAARAGRRSRTRIENCAPSRHSKSDFALSRVSGEDACSPLFARLKDATRKGERAEWTTTFNRSSCRGIIHCAGERADEHERFPISTLAFIRTMTTRFALIGGISSTFMAFESFASLSHRRNLISSFGPTSYDVDVPAAHLLHRSKPTQNICRRGDHRRDELSTTPIGTDVSNAPTDLSRSTGGKEGLSRSIIVPLLM